MSLLIQKVVKSPETEFLAWRKFVRRLDLEFCFASRKMKYCQQRQIAAHSFNYIHSSDVSEAVDLC